MTRHDEQVVGGLTGPVYDEVRMRWITVNNTKYCMKYYEWNIWKYGISNRRRRLPRAVCLRRPSRCECVQLDIINRTWIIHVHAILQKYYYKYISRRTLSTKSVVIAYSVIGETCLQALEWRVNIAWLKTIFGRFFRIFWIFLIF